MTAITKVNKPSISTGSPPTNVSMSGLFAGEAIGAGDACYIKSSDGKVYKSSGAATGLSAPNAPALATATSGGTVLAGIYGVVISYINATGETVASVASFIATSGSTSTITVTSPASAGSGGSAATAYRVYMTPANGGPYKLQNGAGTAIATDFTLTAPPVTNTATPLTSDTSGSTAAAVVDGFAPTDYASGDPISLYWNVRFAYGASLTPGAFVYLDTTAGGLNTAPTSLGTVAIGRVVDATRIELFRSY